jgi:glycosyltransferase involved in cell wall biosynthesis
VIAAWESIVATDDPNLKLVIVGAPGWKCREILNTIESRAKSGDLIHLQNLSSFELQALYRNAEAFVFPSFAEGFGLPPLEALACSTPSVVSDLPNSRWVMEDAALYANPYDVQDIANAVRRLTSNQDRAETKQKLLRDKDRVLKRYSIETIAAQWEALFSELKTRHKQ